MMRPVVVTATLVMLISTSVRAEDLSGLDCDNYPQIPAERCASWKTFNASKRWWCHWNLTTGAIDGLWEDRDPPVSPGLDLTKITRELARSDNATRALLEAYARQQLRQHEDVIGFKPDGFSLRLVDFVRRPPGAHAIVMPDGTVSSTPIPAISTIHLQQIVKQAPLFGATIQLQVDDSNRLVSFFSNLVPGLPANVPNHKISLTAALEIATVAVAPGVTLGPDDSVTGEAAYAIVGGTLRPTFEVYASIDHPGVDARVEIDGVTGAVIRRVDSGSGENPPGFQAVTARLFPDHPVLEATTTTPNDFVAGMQELPLDHVLTPAAGSPFELKGYFVDVENAQFSRWASFAPDFRLPDDLFALRRDDTPGDDDYCNAEAYNNFVGGTVCANFDARQNCHATATGKVPRPDSILAQNQLWESRFDELEAYSYVDAAASYFEERQHHKLGRSSRARPRLEVRVNFDGESGPKYCPGGSPACFSPRKNCLTITGITGGCDYRPVITVEGNDCWRLINGGNDYPAPSPASVSDFYSWIDASREQGVMRHEFTHAIVFDVVNLENAGFGGPFNEAVADFFPASTLTTNGSINPWKDGNGELCAPGIPGGRELDPPYPCRPPTDAEDDRAYPGSFRVTDARHLDPTEPHAEGYIWSQFLWDLRKRAVLLKNQFKKINIDEHSVEDLQFEGFTRMPELLGFSETTGEVFDPTADEPFGPAEALSELLDADAGLTGKELHYDIVASAARHGIKLASTIAAGEVHDYAVRVTTNASLSFTVYGGTNQFFDFDASPDPSLVRNPTLPGRRVRISCGPDDRCRLAPIEAAIDRVSAKVVDTHNTSFTFTLGGTAIAMLVGTSSTAVPVYWQVHTFKHDPNDPNPLHTFDDRYSTILGAGLTLQDPDLPAFLLVPPGATVPCSCDLTRGFDQGAALGVTAASALLAGIFGFRRRRRGKA